MPASGYEDPASVPLDGLHIIHSPLRQQTASPTSVESSPDSPDRKHTSVCSRRSSLSRRRSVSSMKDLMPLTLSTSTSSHASPVLSEETLKARVDDYLPELLARDLHLSGDLFAAKNMTAGAPSYSVVADYMARARATGKVTNRFNMAPPYQQASARVRVLGSIEEQDSITSFLEQHEKNPYSGYPDTSDMDDLSSEGSSSGVPPPSFRYRRNMSIITSSTSFSSSCQRQSPQLSPLSMEPSRCSWIDGDSDSEFEMGEESDVAPEPLSPLSPISPRPLTAAETDPSLLSRDQSAASFRSRCLHTKSHSVAEFPSMASPQTAGETSLIHLSVDASPNKPSNRTSFIAQEFQPASLADPSPAERRILVSHMAPLTPPPVPQKHHQRISRLSRENLKKQSLPPAAAAAAAAIARPPAPIVESPPMSEVGTSDADIADKIACNNGQDESWRALDRDYSRTTPPASPPRTFVTWANSATPYVPNFGGDELARVVPLPPDVVETLRVSVACFPETILLSSSLTIETVRSYSKKMRHPETDIPRLASPASSSEDNGKRSLWTMVNPLKRSSSSSLRRSAMRSASGSRAGSISLADSHKAWSAIQNVFGTCSEYICDALFAHIMAYNYLSALLTRSAATAPPASGLLGRHASCRRTTAGSRASADHKQDDIIPRKAASLLGLGDGGGLEPPGSAQAQGGRGSRLVSRTSTVKSTASRPWSRDELLPSQPASSVGIDSSVRAVHEGLYKCIVRLIATARLTSVSGRLDQPIVDADATDADVLFMRSLCEIVRLVEDTS
ncbi:hypothetical protein IF1G_03499 [Cordyceps javanica]|uniref:Uncharacterized protein n=1 Tax=Cordyceps javanica TaxID=43265 RepID=A0A545W5A0_9HYPO|nr:hypothetical protein IF1G_03499 [Cordyceps javanica]TQW09065.1 hypothetical protein IF2G_03496 [Cordyceps javanica]